MARDVLNDDEFALWTSMQGRDQVHSLHVLSRFTVLHSGATRAENAAALLHDVGKTSADLGWFLRIVATLVGARGRRFTEYHDHERIGAELLGGISDTRTVELVHGVVDDEVAFALRDADNI